jgi:hypothetical protein
MSYRGVDDEFIQVQVGQKGLQTPDERPNARLISIRYIIQMVPPLSSKRTASTTRKEEACLPYQAQLISCPLSCSECYLPSNSFTNTATSIGSTGCIRRLHCKKLQETRCVSWILHIAHMSHTSRRSCLN